MLNVDVVVNNIISSYPDRNELMKLDSEDLADLIDDLLSNYKIKKKDYNSIFDSIMEKIDHYKYYVDYVDLKNIRRSEVLSTGNDTFLIIKNNSYIEIKPSYLLHDEILVCEGELNNVNCWKVFNIISRDFRGLSDNELHYIQCFTGYPMDFEVYRLLNRFNYLYTDRRGITYFDYNDLIDFVVGRCELPYKYFNIVVSRLYDCLIKNGFKDVATTVFKNIDKLMEYLKM